MNVNQYGQIYFKTMVKFAIDNSQFYTMALPVRQLLFDVIVIINSITQNYLIVHLIMQVILNQQLFVTLS